MKQERKNYPIKLMARVLEVSRSGFYAYLQRKPSKLELRHNSLQVSIRAAHENSRRTYGPRRIQAELAENAIIAGRDCITRIYKKLQLNCIQNKKFKATTNSNHNLPTAPNLLDQDFSCKEPGKVYGTDITYIITDEGWLYLAGVKDFGSKEIVGYAMSERMTKDLVLVALAKALSYRPIERGCIHHSDRGSQYCATAYQQAVKDAGMQTSMSRKGNCYDNAPTESFWGCLKQELVHHRRFRTRAEAKAAIQEYIEIFYNRVRRHSVLGNIAPARYAQLWYANHKK